MATIFVSQSKLRIQLIAGVDITGATELLIKFRKPDNSLSEWAAISANDANGTIYYDLTDGELDQSGDWSFWSYVTFSDSRFAPGEVVIINIKIEGEE